MKECVEEFFEKFLSFVVYIYLLFDYLIMFRNLRFFKKIVILYYI